MTFAVIHTGGKQYKVSKGDILQIEKLEGESGDVITFDKVLLLDDGSTTKVGAPYIDGLKVSGKIEEQGRDKKKIVAKYMPKSRYFKKNGHRQPHTKVIIESIG